MLTRSNILNLGKLWFQAINIKIIGYSEPKFANFKSTMLTPKFVNWSFENYLKIGVLKIIWRLEFWKLFENWNFEELFENGSF